MNKGSKARDSFAVNFDRNSYQPLTENGQSLPTIGIQSFIPEKLSIIKVVKILVAIIVAVVIYNVKIFEDQPAARRALSLFSFVAIMWATEAIPIFVTSLLIPILVVTMKVLVNPTTNEPLSAKDAATEVMGTLFSGTVLVALGAFTMSLALSKYNLSYRLAAFVLSRVGKRPPVVMLTVMFLGLFLSMWINNVASPVVCISLVQPMLQELPPSEVYAKTLLLGIAFSNNIGGMTTPISSPQNLVAINVIEGTTWNTTANSMITGDLDWPRFLAVSLPFSILCVLAVWAYLWIVFKPTIKEVDPLPPRKLESITTKHIFVVAVCVVTVILWAINNEIVAFTGNTGIIALIPVVCFFSSGILSKDDFKELSWDILMLLAGGLALGDAIQSSGLLAIIAKHLAEAVSNSSHWVVLLTFASFIWLFGNFISHTVAALIVLPVIANVGCSLGGGNCDLGHYKALVMGSVLMDSGAMGLPVSSFPNAQAFSLQDATGKRYLSILDFIKTGFVLGIIELILLMTIGYELLYNIL